MMAEDCPLARHSHGRVPGMLTENAGYEYRILAAVFVGQVADSETSNGLASIVDGDNGALIASVDHGGAVHCKFEGVMAESGGDDAWTVMVSSSSERGPRSYQSQVHR